MLPQDIMLMIFMHLANDRSNQGVVDLYSIDSVSAILRVPKDIWKLCVQANLQQMISNSAYWDLEKLFGLNSKQDYKRFACRIYKTPRKIDLMSTLSNVAEDNLAGFMCYIRSLPQLLDTLDYDNECCMIRVDSIVSLDPERHSKWAFYFYDSSGVIYLPHNIHWFTYTDYMYDPVHVIRLPEMICLMHNNMCELNEQPRDWIGCKSIATHLFLSKVIDMREITSQ